MTSTGDGARKALADRLIRRWHSASLVNSQGRSIFLEDGEYDLLLAALRAPSSGTVTRDATDAQIIAALEWSLEWMRQHNVDGLSPFKDYPPVKETIRGMWNAMVSALPSPAVELREALHKAAQAVGRLDHLASSTTRVIDFKDRKMIVEACETIRAAIASLPAKSVGDVK